MFTQNFSILIGKPFTSRYCQFHYVDKIGPEVINLCYMHKSAEHEICRPDKSYITDNCKFFLAKLSWA